MCTTHGAISPLQPARTTNTALLFNAALLANTSQQQRQQQQVPMVRRAR